MVVNKWFSNEEQRAVIIPWCYNPIYADTDKVTVPESRQKNRSLMNADN
jgi:hypothetical protein